MSFYDEVAKRYRGSVDPSTGMLTRDVESLQRSTECIKRDILGASLRGETHTEVTLRPDKDLYHLVNDRKDQVITYLACALGEEFSVHLDTSDKGYNRLYLIIDWIEPDKKEMELQ